MCREEGGGTAPLNRDLVIIKRRCGQSTPAKLIAHFGNFRGMILAALFPTSKLLSAKWTPFKPSHPIEAWGLAHEN